MNARDQINDAARARSGGAPWVGEESDGVRPVSTRFGILWQVMGTTTAYSTREAAVKHAEAISKGDAR